MILQQITGNITKNKLLIIFIIIIINIKREWD